MRSTFFIVAMLAAGACQEPGGAATHPESNPPSETAAEAREGAASDDDEPTLEQIEGQELADFLAPFVPSGPPDSYGEISPTHPPPPAEALTLHALAGYEVVAIYDTPDLQATKLGYLRIGTRLMVTPRVEGKGCDGGWHQLPRGGFACASKGLVVDAKKPPYMFRPPPPPRLESSLPYDYAFVRESYAPMWWRVPTDEEFAAARAYRRSKMPAKVPPVNEVAASETGASDAAVTEASAVEGREKPRPSPSAPPPRLPLNPDTPWLERGFFISLAEQLEDKGRMWWKTARGGYVHDSDATAWTPKDFQGVELADDVTFPFGFIMAMEGSPLLSLTERGTLEPTETLARKAFIDLAGEIELDGKTYYVTHDGRLIKSAHVRLAEPQPVPEGLALWERWIDVNLDKQMLIAYEGTRPVYVTLVSTGRPGAGEKNYETPTGRWRIRSKHVSSTMDGDTASDGSYSIQDVPWTMFFEGSYALHGAFWHDGFGRVRSHGCVNLGPTDAHWLFQWTTPALPEGWHGVHAHPGSPGTTIVVRKKPPEEPALAAG